MDTKHINYILTIAKRKNMTKAAEELYVSQSSLSQYLAKLEQELDTPLFYRTKWELIPTPAGELYIEACHQVMEIKQKLYQQIRSLDDSGNIAVGVTSQFGLKMLTEIIPNFKKEYPHFNITISKGSLLLVKKMLMEETVDVAIVADIEISPVFKDFTDVLRKEELLFAVPGSHPYVQKNTSSAITVKEITENFNNTNFLMAKEGSSLKKAYNNIFSGTDFTPNIMCQTNSIPTVSYMVAAGTGASLIAESCSQFRDKIVFYSFVPPEYRLNLLVRRRSWVLHKPEQVFCRMIKQYFQKHLEIPYLA